jgi:hypothetical protein
MPVTNRDVNQRVHDPKYPEVSGVLESVGTNTAVVRNDAGELLYPVAEDLHVVEPKKEVQTPLREGAVELSPNGTAKSTEVPSRS